MAVIAGGLGLAGCALGHLVGGVDETVVVGAGHLAQPPEVRSPRGVVAAGSPEAARAGAAILAAGGNAVDAAVAAAFALSATDPGESGLGGETFALIHLADGRNVAIDGVAPVPLAIDRKVLRRRKQRGTLFGYPVVAVPTTVAALAHTLERYGTMSFSRVLEPAVAAAEAGYHLGFCERGFIGAYADKLRWSPVLGPQTLAGRRPRPLGTHIVAGAVATTLRRLQSEGPQAFYRGSIARTIAHDMAVNGGFVSLADLALVRIRELRPEHGRYRGREVLSFPDPGGGAAVVEALGIVDRFPPQDLATPTLMRLQILTEAVHIATHDTEIRFAEGSSRLAVFASPAFMGAADPGERARLIRFDRALTEADLGAEGVVRPGEHNTTQLSVADGAGNIVALTQTLGRCYGACVATPGLGFPYNSLLEAYGFDDPANPYYLRPRAVMPSWISPTIVLDEHGGPTVALGSAGSGRIVSAVVDTLVNLEDGGMSLPAAVGAARVLWGGPGDRQVYLEIAAPVTEADTERMRELGYNRLYGLHFPARPIDLAAFGGVNAVMRDKVTEEWVAVADPRRDGGVAAPGS